MTNTVNNPSLLNIQFGIFFSRTLSRPDLLTREISDNYSEYFDGVPINLPIPADIADFPVAQLSSNDGKWKLNISRLRADIVYTPDEGKIYEEINEEEKKIIEMMKSLSIKAREESDMKISRIANISTFIYRTDKPNEFLRDKFFQEKSGSYSELSIRFNQAINCDGLQCNNIENYQVTKLKKDGEENLDEVLLIQRDFNTDVRKDEFSDKEIEKFWKESKSKSHVLVFNQANHE